MRAVGYVTVVTTLTAPLPSVAAVPARGLATGFRWTYDEYQRLVEHGFTFRGRMEFVGGRIVRRAAQKALHVAGVELAKLALGVAFGPGFWVRTQAPLHLDRWSGPEPDAAVPGGPRDYVGTGHPRSALLVVEVSDTTLRYDRRRKGPRYARAAYADYWIVNLVDRCVEVYRHPVADPSAPLGWRYADVAVLTAPAEVAPLAAPAAPVRIADLLP